MRRHGRLCLSLSRSKQATGKQKREEKMGYNRSMAIVVQPVPGLRVQSMEGDETLINTWAAKRGALDLVCYGSAKNLKDVGKFYPEPELQELSKQIKGHSISVLWIGEDHVSGVQHFRAGETYCDDLVFPPFSVRKMNQARKSRHK